MRLLGIDFQIGYGEIVGNPCYHDDSKRDEDCEKVLKVMHLALYKLQQFLAEKGIEKKRF
nr:175_t:CDS:2 [Entrophospora candida]